MSNSTLCAKAHSIEQWVEDHFVDDLGVIYTFIDKNTFKPPQEQLFHDAGPGMNIFDFHVENYTRGEVAAYENCGMCTGAYMQALLFRFRRERDPEALRKARRGYNAIKAIFNLGKQLETGFFPKIYGQRFSVQTSTDQVLYAATALDHYYEFASATEQREISDMITQMVYFWVRRQYRYTYFHWPNMIWPSMRFPALLQLAYKHSADHVFLREYDKFIAAGITREPEYSELARKRNGEISPSEFEQKNGAWLIEHMGDWLTMDVMNFATLLNLVPDSPLVENWKRCMLSTWDIAKLTLAPDGKYYSQLLLDMKDHSLRRLPGYEQDGSDFHGSKSGWSTMLARGAVMVSKYSPQNPELEIAATKVLTALDIADLTYYDEPERLAPRYRFKTRFLSGDAITNWLWAYWQGNEQNMFAEKLISHVPHSTLTEV